MAERNLTIRLDDDLRALFEARAKTEERTLTFLVTRAMKRESTKWPPPKRPKNAR
jgi:predicted transcriptional regulator